MTVLKELRGELADTIGQAVPDLTTYDHAPGRINLPALVVLAGSPYIEAGETFGEKTVRFGALLLTHPTLNDAETDALDAQIETAQHALDAAGWRVELVAQPTIQELNGSEIYATEIHVASLVTFPTD